MLLRDLVEAVEAQNVALVDAILSHQPQLLQVEIAAEQGHNHSLLHRAIPSDGVSLTDAHMAIVRRLLDSGAEVDAIGWGANNGLCTPLTMAAWGGHAPIVRLLISRGAEPNGSPEQVICRRRPIDTAAEHGHAEAVEALIEGGAAYSLAHLLKVGLVVQVEQFLKRDPGIAARSLEDGTPPLHLAVMSSHSEGVVELLLSKGADLRSVDRLGRTALHVAIEHDQPQAVRRLVDLGAPKDIFAASGMGDRVRIAELVEQDGTLARAEQSDGVTALFYAAWAGDARSVELLISHGAHVSPRAKRFWACVTPLHVALQRRHRDVVTVLLDHGTDVNAWAVEKYWPTPLHVAARWGTAADVRRLLEHGADPNGGDAITGGLGASGLAWAVLVGDEGLVSLLLNHGLDLGHPTHREALHLAAEHGHLKLVRLLIQNGAAPHSQDVYGETPKERARRFGRTKVVDFLEACGG